MITRKKLKDKNINYTREQIAIRVNVDDLKILNYAISLAEKDLKRIEKVNSSLSFAGLDTSSRNKQCERINKFFSDLKTMINKEAKYE